jgi:hypothetical protein
MLQKIMRETKHSDRWALGWTAFFFFVKNESENCVNQKL